LKKLNWQEPLALFDVAQTRQLESLGLARVNSGPSLMAQAGLAVAKLALAIKPFAPVIGFSAVQAITVAMVWKRPSICINGGVKCAWCFGSLN
jgi:hypothetical protein